uniref:uncharacterized protein isoform X2 n=1 Tax=Myxine glutinosa TaxID=7769 RepID=UPI00358EE607
MPMMSNGDEDLHHVRLCDASDVWLDGESDKTPWQVTAAPAGSSLSSEDALQRRRFPAPLDQAMETRSMSNKHLFKNASSEVLPNPQKKSQENPLLVDFERSKNRDLEFVCKACSYTGEAEPLKVPLSTATAFGGLDSDQAQSLPTSLDMAPAVISDEVVEHQDKTDLGGKLENLPHVDTHTAELRSFHPAETSLSRSKLFDISGAMDEISLAQSSQSEFADVQRKDACVREVQKLEQMTQMENDIILLRYLTYKMCQQRVESLLNTTREKLYELYFLLHEENMVDFNTFLCRPPSYTLQFCRDNCFVVPQFLQHTTCALQTEDVSSCAVPAAAVCTSTLPTGAVSSSAQPTATVSSCAVPTAMVSPCIVPATAVSPCIVPATSVSYAIPAASLSCMLPTGTFTSKQVMPILHGFKEGVVSESAPEVGSLSRFPKEAVATSASETTVEARSFTSAPVMEVTAVSALVQDIEDSVVSESVALLEPAVEVGALSASVSTLDVGTVSPLASAVNVVAMSATGTTAEMLAALASVPTFEAGDMSVLAPALGACDHVSVLAPAIKIGDGALSVTAVDASAASLSVCPGFVGSVSHFVPAADVEAMSDSALVVNAEAALVSASVVKDVAVAVSETATALDAKLISVSKPMLGEVAMSMSLPVLGGAAVSISPPFLGAAAVLASAPVLGAATVSVSAHSVEMGALSQSVHIMGDGTRSLSAVAMEADAVLEPISTVQAGGFSVSASAVEAEAISALAPARVDEAVSAFATATDARAVSAPSPITKHGDMSTTAPAKEAQYVLASAPAMEAQDVLVPATALEARCGSVLATEVKTHDVLTFDPTKEAAVVGPAEDEPTSASAEDEPTPASAEDEPTPASAEDGPTPASAEDGPTPASAEDGPTPASAEDGPTPASAEDGPTPASAEDGPTPASAEDGPTPASAEDGPTPASAEDGPTPASAEDAPTAATAEDEPTAASAEDEPTAASAEDEPTAASAEDEPTSATAEDEPTSATAEDEPTSATAEDEPTSATAEDEPTSATAEDEPTSATAEDEPTSATAEDEPTSATAEDEPTSATAEDEPTSATAEDEPTSATAEDEPTSATAEDEPTSATAEDEPTSATAEDEPTSATAEDEPTSATAEDEPTSAPAEDEPTSATAEDEPTSATAEDDPTSATAGDEPTSATAGDEPTSATAEDEPTSATAEDEPTSAYAEDLSYRPFLAPTENVCDMSASALDFAVEKAPATNEYAGDVLVLSAGAGVVLLPDEVEVPAPDKVVGEVPAPDDAAVDVPALENAAVEVPEVPAPDEAAMEVSVPEEAAVEVPVLEEARVEVPALEEAAVGVPAPEEAAVEVPALEETAMEEPAPKEAVVEVPAWEEAVVEVPAREEAVVEVPAWEEAVEEVPAWKEGVAEVPEPEEAAVEVPVPEETAVEMAVSVEGIEEASAPVVGIEEASAPVHGIEEAWAPIEVNESLVPVEGIKPVEGAEVSVPVEDAEDASSPIRCTRSFSMEKVLLQSCSGAVGSAAVPFCSAGDGAAFSTCAAEERVDLECAVLTGGLLVQELHKPGHLSALRHSTKEQGASGMQRAPFDSNSSDSLVALQALGAASINAPDDVIQIPAITHLTDSQPSTESEPLSLSSVPNMEEEDEIVKRAKQEAEVQMRVAQLKQKGLWSLKKLTRYPEPPRPKTHRDYLLEEMQWLAGDFAQERRWKRALAKKLARMVVRFHDEQKQKEERAKKDELSKLRRIASGIAKEVKHFWNNIEKVLQFKQQSLADEKRKKDLDKHLNYIVGQTEKYSDWLSQSLNESRPASSYGGSVGCSPAPSEREDEDFEPEDEDDDEETIALEEEVASIGVGEHKREIELLQQEGNLPLEELLRSLPPEMRQSVCHMNRNNSDKLAANDEGSRSPNDGCEQNRSTAVLIESEDVKKHEGTDDDDEEEEEDVDVEQHEEGPLVKDIHTSEVTCSGADDDAEYDAGEEDDEDMEQTIDEQEAMEGMVNHQEELEDLAREGELRLEELLEKYKGAFMDHPEETAEYHEGEDSDSFITEEEEEEEENEDNEDQDEQKEVDSMSISENGPDKGEEDSKGAVVLGMESLKDTTKEIVQVSSTDLGGPKKEITDIAAAAESLQPTGYTLATAQVKTPVPSLLRGELREYQHIGLDWLVTMHDKMLNGILADEMGLGKTIQTIALLAHLACDRGVWGPHLIVVPTSVMLNWEMEFKRWSPAFKILTYYGVPKERKQKRQGWTRPNAFHVCITSYKLVLQDHQAFRRKKWRYLILDEAQNIKNFKSQRWQSLLNFNSEHRLLLTGTPLQNSLMELWSLMHFLMPHVFQSHREFREWFSNPLTGMIEGSQEYNDSLVKRLHKVLRPFLLRRVKMDVEKQMPKKYEHVVRCRLSKRQRFLYDDFMSQASTKETLASGHFMSVINILMQLRKVCNHPNLFDPRPISSPFITQGICYNTASLVLSACELDPWKSVDLSIFDLINLEGRLSRYEAEVFLPNRKVNLKLIEEISSSPDPPPRPKPVKMKVNRMVQPVQKPDGRTVVVVSSSKVACTDYLKQGSEQSSVPAQTFLQRTQSIQKLGVSSLVTSAAAVKQPSDMKLSHVVPGVTSAPNPSPQATVITGKQESSGSGLHGVPPSKVPEATVSSVPLLQHAPCVPSMGSKDCSAEAGNKQVQRINKDVMMDTTVTSCPVTTIVQSTAVAQPKAQILPLPVAPAATITTGALNRAPRMFAALPVQQVAPSLVSAGRSTLQTTAATTIVPSTPLRMVQSNPPMVGSPRPQLLQACTAPGATVQQRVVLTPQTQARLPTGEVISIAQLAALMNQNPPGQPLTLHIQGNKLALACSPVRMLNPTPQQHLQIQGGIVHVIKPSVQGQVTAVTPLQTVSSAAKMIQVSRPIASPFQNRPRAPTLLVAHTASLSQAARPNIPSTNIIRAVSQTANVGCLPVGLQAVRPRQLSLPTAHLVFSSTSQLALSSASQAAIGSTSQAAVVSASQATVAFVPQVAMASSPQVAVAAVASAPQAIVVSAPQVAVAYAPQVAVSSAPQVAVSSAPQVAVSSAPQVAVASAPQVAVASAPQVVVASAPQVVVASAPQAAVAPAPQTAVASAPQVAVTSVPQAAVTYVPQAAVASIPKVAVALPVSTKPSQPIHSGSAEKSSSYQTIKQTPEIQSIRQGSHFSTPSVVKPAQTRTTIRIPSIPVPAPVERPQTRRITAAQQKLEKPEASPLQLSWLEKLRLRRHKECLTRLYTVTARRCAASPIYGVEVLRMCDLRGDSGYMVTSPVHGGAWSWVGAVHCLHCKPGAQPEHHTCFWRKTAATSAAIALPEDRLAQLQNIIDRFIFVVPPVEAPPISLHTSHPPPWLVHGERLLRRTLHDEFSLRSAYLHRIRCNMRTQFPDLRLIQYDCGKLQTLDILLRRFKAGTHRVLIFTQMTRMLDILEQFLNFHGYIYLRLDGTTRVEQRQALMDLFNADPRIFCFILSTRSGGVGVNLTGADTVVFYDSDWNPTMDAQAQDRCHRIGQTRDVHIYRLIGERTVEENILKKANQKRMLGDVAIEGGNFTTAYFKQQSIRELFENPEEIARQEAAVVAAAAQSSQGDDDGNPSRDNIFEQALGRAEDEEDTKAANQAKAEQVAELAEFSEVATEEGDDEGRDDEEPSKAEEEINSLVEQLTPIERYALKFLENSLAPDGEESQKARDTSNAAKKESRPVRPAAFTESGNLGRGDDITQSREETDEFILEEKQKTTDQLHSVIPSPKPDTSGIDVDPAATTDVLDTSPLKSHDCSGKPSDVIKHSQEIEASTDDAQEDQVPSADRREQMFETSSMTSLLPQQSENVQPIVEDVKPIEEDVKPIEEDVKQIEEDVEQIEEDVQPIEQNVKLIEEDVEQIEEGVQPSEQNVKLIEEDVEQIEEDVQPIEQNVKLIEEDVEQIEEDVQPIEQNVELIEQNVMPSQHSHVEQDLGGLEVLRIAKMNPIPLPISESLQSVDSKDNPEEPAANSEKNDDAEVGEDETPGCLEDEPTTIPSHLLSDTLISTSKIEDHIDTSVESSKVTSSVAALDESMQSRNKLVQHPSSSLGKNKLTDTETTTEEPPLKKPRTCISEDVKEHEEPAVDSSKGRSDDVKKKNGNRKDKLQMLALGHRIRCRLPSSSSPVRTRSRSSKRVLALERLLNLPCRSRRGTFVTGRRRKDKIVERVVERNKKSKDKLSVQHHAKGTVVSKGTHYSEKASREMHTDSQMRRQGQIMISLRRKNIYKQKLDGEPPAKLGRQEAQSSGASKMEASSSTSSERPSSPVITRASLRLSVLCQSPTRTVPPPVKRQEHARRALSFGQKAEESSTPGRRGDTSRLSPTKRVTRQAIRRSTARPTNDWD